MYKKVYDIGKQVIASDLNRRGRMSIDDSLPSAPRLHPEW